MDEYEPESGNFINDSDGNDMDFVPQTPPDPQPSISTQSQSVSDRYPGRGAARGRGRGSKSIYSTCE